MNLSLAYGPRGGLGPPIDDDPTITGTVRRAMTLAERIEIEIGVRTGVSRRGIGRAIGRDASIIAREIDRNSGSDGIYRAVVAHRAAHQRRRRPRGFKLEQLPELCAAITGWLEQGWSPRLISEVLTDGDAAAAEAERDPTVVPAMRMGSVCAETIYQTLYVQTRGGLRADLHKELSLGRSTRRPRTGRPPTGTRAAFAEAVTISQRPAEIADRAVPGHWEGDLILGSLASGSAIGTLVERSTRFTILLHLPGRRDAASVAAAMIEQMGRLPEHLRRSVTWDRGAEMARWKDIEMQLSMPIYFADPHSPWQRGSNENTNRLLRHWFAKGTDLRAFDREDLDRIATTLNQRPRPTLGLKTPAHALTELIERAPS